MAICKLVSKSTSKPTAPAHSQCSRSAASIRSTLAVNWPS